MCDSGKGETFCEGNKKVRSARKISRYARNDGMVCIALCVIAEKGKRFAKGARKSRVQGRFLDCARNDGIGGMGLFHVAYNGYVWKALFLYRHPDRSGGIFLAHWYSAVCVIAEKGKPFAKGTRKCGVQGRFLATLEMTVWCVSPYA